MLELDLGRLEREDRVAVEADVAPDHPLLKGAAARFHGPLEVRLATQKAGPDVLVRGRITGEVELDCRRCLTDVVVGMEEAVVLLFRAGVDEAEAEAQGVYPLPERARELDLKGPVREHILLAIPQYATCREACRGLCPRCGANWNQTTCDCEAAEPDARWAPLRELKLD